MATANERAVAGALSRRVEPLYRAFQLNVARLLDHAPVTLAVAVAQTAVFTLSPLKPRAACFEHDLDLRSSASAEAGISLLRGFVSSVHHLNWLHLALNMASLLQLGGGGAAGHGLEGRFGSAAFAGVLLLLTALTEAANMALCLATAQLGLPDWCGCSVGFSGVIFALHTLRNEGSADKLGHVSFGTVSFVVPIKQAVWAQAASTAFLMLLAGVRVANDGHVAGILAGIAFAYAARQLQGHPDASLAAVVRSASGVTSPRAVAGWSCLRPCEAVNESAADTCAKCGKGKDRGTLHGFFTRH